VWAGTLWLRIGEQRDVVVAVQVDTDASLNRLRTLLEPWLEAGIEEAWAGFAPAFGVLLEPVGDGAAHPRPAPRPVPQLRHGSTVIARSRRPDDIVRALAQVLGGVHLQRRDDDRVWTNRRPFVRNGSLVLVDALPPTLVNDRQLSRAGIEELAAWAVTVEGDRFVSVPPPLPDLAWDSIGIEAPTGDAKRFERAGVALQRDARALRAEITTLFDTSGGD
jgi:hypothetical protein